MSVLRDTRTMLAPLPSHTEHGEPTGYPQRLVSPEAIEEHWQAFAAERIRKGFEPFTTAPARRELHRSRTAVQAYVSDGRWVAQCPGGPTGKCNGGIACWPEHDAACCLDCGTIYKVDFPAAGEIAGAEEVLAAREPENRHWWPHRGETVADLKADNLRHGHGLDPEQETARRNATKLDELAAWLDQLTPGERKAALAGLRKPGGR